MVVVQPFAGDEPGEPLVVGGQVVVGPLAPLVPDPVDGASPQQVHRRMGHGRDQPDLPSEHGDQEPDAEPEAEQGVIEQHRVPAVAGEITGIAADGHRVPGDSPVEQGVAELDPGVAEDDGRVRIALLVGMGMVLPVHRDPLPGSGPGRHPDDEPAGERHRRLHGDGPVGQSPVQVHRRDDEGDLGDQQPDEDGLEDRGHADNLAQTATKGAHDELGGRSDDRMNLVGALKLVCSPPFVAGPVPGRTNATAARRPRPGRDNEKVLCPTPSTP